jgi:hypothetical protein
MRCYLSFLLLVQLSAAMAQPEKANVARAGQATPGRDSCGDNRSIPSLVKHLAGTVIFKQSLAALAEQVKREPAREFTVAFGQDSLGEVVASGLEGGNKRSGVITELPFPVADMHNHPRNTPPSSGDLYGLISQNRKKGTYAVRFVLTSGNLMYALVITDSLAAHTFTKKLSATANAGILASFSGYSFAGVQRHAVPLWSCRRSRDGICIGNVQYRCFVIKALR